MTTVDNRVVQMTFESRQFESGATGAIRTLDKLKQAMTFK